MNKKKLLKLADTIENSKITNLDFNMRYILNTTECGTAGCIAGWAFVSKTGCLDSSCYDIEEEAIEYLEAENDYEMDVLNDLFYPENKKFFFVSPSGEIVEKTSEKYKKSNLIPDVAGWEATPKQAAMVIRHLVETGVVDWDLPFEKNVDTSNKEC